MKLLSRHGSPFVGAGCLLVVVLSVGFLHAQEIPNEAVLFHAKVFTGDPENPYAEAVAIRDGKIVAVGNLAEVSKAAADFPRIDLAGRSLFPGFIDSHSHSIDGGLTVTGADITDKVDTLKRLPAFVDEARKTHRGMRGDILEITGIPLEFWSHLDILNA
ncbi:MAG TPA: amidohydrolase family protein, partial [Candidatus Sulfotelmatobacter sp.]